MPKTLQELSTAYQVLDLGDVVPFGKHKGETVLFLLEVHPGYIVWMHDNTQWKVKDRIYEVAKQQFTQLKQDWLDRAESLLFDDCDFEDSLEWDNIWH